MAKAFKTWTFWGVRFLGFPNFSNLHVIDEDGRNYGGWRSVDEFRKHQQNDKYDIAKPLSESIVELSGRLKQPT